MKTLITFILFIGVLQAVYADDIVEAMAAAQGVIDRVTGGNARNIRFERIPSEATGDVYEYEANDAILVLRGSSPVAFCRAFYDYIRANGMGMVSWAEGLHVRIPQVWPNASKTCVAAPFKIRHAYNAVTFGYTFPYWNWERWERELDWQALRGFNMLMAHVATEAIMDRFWNKQGLSQSEVDAYNCGPAHLPWQRMGCICGIGGPLPESWHVDQVALQHKILGRMRELGMEPVVPGFNGFVPRSFSRIHPEADLHETLWNEAIPSENRPLLLVPDDPSFAVITRAYMEEWSREFGEATLMTK